MKYIFIMLMYHRFIFLVLLVIVSPVQNNGEELLNWIIQAYCFLKVSHTHITFICNLVTNIIKITDSILKVAKCSSQLADEVVALIRINVFFWLHRSIIVKVPICLTLICTDLV